MYLIASEKLVFIRSKWFFIALLTLLFTYPAGYFVLGPSKAIDEAPLFVTGEEIGAYIINLERSKERYDYVKNSVQGLGLKSERIPAVDGKNLSEQDIKEKVDLDSYKLFLGHFPKRGTIGCSLSHIKAWQTFLNSNLKFALIFEDDISFDPSKLKPILEDLVKNSELWDVVNLEVYHGGCPLPIKKLRNHQQLSVYLMEVTHAGAYLINRKAAQNLLAKALPIKMPIDHYFTRSWELDIKFTGIENPRLVAQTFGGSEIARTEKLPNENIPLLDSLKRGLYKLQSYTVRFFYNLKMYLTA